MIYGSVCSGIEAATAAWHRLGWKPAFFSEIEAFPRAVLAHHYQETPLHGDFTTIKAGDYQPIDLLVGGTPCQSFSIAGLRGGLSDDRGNLALEYLRLADRLRPRWLVWENVPGVLSSNGGRDFGSILGGMVELGYGVAYRVLDAQFFGLAQRRRRVFVVGYFGDWRRAAAVLFERNGLSGNPPPSRKAGERPAPTISARPTGGGGLGTDFDLDGGLVQAAAYAPVISPALKARDFKGPSSDGDGDGDGAPLIAHALRAEGFDASEDGTGRGTPIVPVSCHLPFDTTPVTSAANRSNPQHGDPCHPLVAGGDPPAIAYAIQERAVSVNLDAGPQGAGWNEENAYTLEARNKVQAVAFALRGREGGAQAEIGGEVSNALRTPGGGASVPMIAHTAVRRLTPEECEKLQGFPVGFTNIPWRGKNGAPDGPRYKALGNSFAVPVVRWIGERIAQVDAIQVQEQAA